MCLAKVVVSCPRCKTPQRVTRPDSDHPFWSFEKPADHEEGASSLQQVLNCKNSGCNEKFDIYWYNK